VLYPIRTTVKSSQFHRSFRYAYCCRANPRAITLMASSMVYSDPNTYLQTTKSYDIDCRRGCVRCHSASDGGLFKAINTQFVRIIAITIQSNHLMEKSCYRHYNRDHSIELTVTSQGKWKVVSTGSRIQI
jgi:hypothetical protein